MKLKIIGKKTVIEFTEKELITLLCALDSASTAIEYMESAEYKDVPKLSDKLSKLIALENQKKALRS